MDTRRQHQNKVSRHSAGAQLSVYRLAAVCFGVMCVLQGTLNIALRLCLNPSASSESDAVAKILFFPKASNDSYVTLTSLKPLHLEAFTLCMCLSVDPVVNQLGRETILFAYRTTDCDELNVWQEKGGISLYLSSSETSVMSLLRLSTFPTFPTNICLTWESSTGLTAFWMDGSRSVLQPYRKNHTVQPGGTIILGQDPDSLLGSFDQGQSFVGEITDVNMWDYVLTGSQIRQLHKKKSPTPNVLKWSSLEYEVNGNVLEVPEKYY